MSGVGTAVRPVLVAVAEVQERVLEEAIAESRRTGAPLHVVTCWEDDGGPVGETFGETCLADGSAVMAHLSRDAATLVRDFVTSRAPELDVTISLECGPTSDVVRDEARGAREVVVGADGDLPRYLWMFRGAVARRLVATSPRPTVVVPDRGARQGGDVVLVMPTWTPDALTFALAAARERGAVLRVVHEPHSPGRRGDRRRTSWRHALDIVSSPYPDVDVAVETTPRGRMVETATTGAAATSLVVVGSTPWAGRPWFLDRSMAGRLAARTVVPLAVVPATGRRGRGLAR